VRRRCRSRSARPAEPSTQPPDELAVPDWRAWRVVVNDRAAIYAEAFPGVLDSAEPQVVWVLPEALSPSAGLDFAVGSFGPVSPG
jgi:hypothetical protein